MTKPRSETGHKYNSMFVWNDFLIKNGFSEKEKEMGETDWVVPIIRGFVDQSGKFSF